MCLIGLPNIKPSHSFSFITSEGTWLKRREMKPRDLVTERLVQQTNYVRLQPNYIEVILEFTYRILNLKWYSLTLMYSANDTLLLSSFVGINSEKVACSRAKCLILFYQQS